MVLRKMSGSGIPREVGPQGVVAIIRDTSRGSGSPLKLEGGTSGEGSRGRDLYSKTGSRVLGEGFRGGRGVGRHREKV